jgi:DNA-binding GntR family transcriptional regulator
LSNKKISKQRQSQNERAYQEIKNKIIDLSLKPGAEIEEKVLVKNLSIGRTPIREALFRLVAENLIEIIQGRGFFVRQITFKDVKDLFEALLVFEKVAVIKALNRIRPEKIDLLHDTNNGLTKAWREENYLRVAKINREFHNIIYDATDNIFLASYLKNLQNQAQRLAYMCVSVDNKDSDLKCYFGQSIKDHKDLIKAFEQKDEAKAVQNVTMHIEHFYRKVINFTSFDIDTLNIAN